MSLVRAADRLSDPAGTLQAVASSGVASQATAAAITPLAIGTKNAVLVPYSSIRWPAIAAPGAIPKRDAGGEPGDALGQPGRRHRLLD